jgi:hypothetical protein
LRPAVENAAGGVTQKRYVYGTKSECPSPAPMVAEVLPKRRCVRMKVLIGVDPHKASIAVAVVDEAKGQLLERASFSQDRAGLSASPDRTVVDGYPLLYETTDLRASLQRRRA